MRKYTATDFDTRVALYSVQYTQDDEANIVKNKQHLYDMWAHVIAKRSSIQREQAAQREVIHYTLIFRKNAEMTRDRGTVSEIRLPYGEVVKVTAPAYITGEGYDKYIVIEAEETDGREKLESKAGY